MKQYVILTESFIELGCYCFLSNTAHSQLDVLGIE